MQETAILADAACDMPRSVMAELKVHTIASTRSKLYANATGAVIGTVARSVRLRKEAGRTGLFELTVVDTGAIGPGQALIVREAARMAAAGASPQAVREAVETRLRDAA